MRIASAQTVNPSYLVVSRDRNYVYAVNELPGDNGPASQRGGISAFRFDRASGQLSFLNRVSSDGNDPCYLALSPDGKYLLTANYSVAANPGGRQLRGVSAARRWPCRAVRADRASRRRRPGEGTAGQLACAFDRFLAGRQVSVRAGFGRGQGVRLSLHAGPSASNRGLFGPTTTSYTPIKPGSGPRAISSSIRAANTRI